MRDELEDRIAAHLAEGAGYTQAAVEAWMHNEDDRINLANYRRNIRLREAAERVRKEL